MAIQQILTFEGGLSTKISPHLIGRNEGIICQNVDLEKGSLHPLQDFSLEATTTGKYTEHYDGSYIANTDPDDERFYAEYAGRLYWSNAEYGTYGLMRYDGTSTGIDAEAPSPLNELAKPTPTASTEFGRLTNTASYTYAVTVVDADGIESTPIFTDEVALANPNDLSILLSVNKVNMNTYLPTGHTLNLYRTGGANPTYNLIMENMSPANPAVIDGDTDPDYATGHFHFLDDKADIDVSRIELTTFENTPPPEDLDMLIENLGTFWGAVNNRVYFSRVGTPEFWGQLDYVVLDKPCTGLGVFSDYVMAFTESGAYRIAGYSRDTVQVEKLPYNQGCVNKDTITNIDTYLVWVSKNGVCLFDGAQIQVMTKQKLGWDDFNLVDDLSYDDFSETQQWNTGSGFEVTFSRGYRDKYFGIYSGGIGILDMSSGVKFYTVEFQGADSLFYNEIDNVLFVVKGTEIYAYNTSNNLMTATWKTGRVADEGTNVNKHYRDVELDGTPVSVEVFIDGESKKIYYGKSRFKLPAGSIGKDIQFEIKTNNEIRSLKYEYNQLKA